MCCSVSWINDRELKCNRCGYRSSKKEEFNPPIPEVQDFGGVKLHCPKCCYCESIMYEIWDEEDWG